MVGVPGVVVNWLGVQRSVGVLVVAIMWLGRCDNQSACWAWRSIALASVAISWYADHLAYRLCYGDENAGCGDKLTCWERHQLAGRVWRSIVIRAEGAKVAGRVRAMSWRAGNGNILAGRVLAISWRADQLACREWGGKCWMSVEIS